MCYIRNDNNQQPAGEGICTRWARGLLSCTLTPMLPTTAASGKKVSCVYMCICLCVYLCVGVYSVCVCIWGVCVYLCASVCVHVYVSVSVLSMCVCVHLCVYLYVHVWGLGMYLCICPHIQECGCVWLFLCLVCGYVWRTVWLSACVCVCLCAHLWPMCMTVNLSDCLCVCVCVCVCISPTLPHAPEAEHAAPDWVSSVIIYSTSKATAVLFAAWPDARLHQWQLSCFLCWHSTTPETLTGVLRKCIYLLTAQNDPLQPENEIQAEWYLLQGILISHQLFSQVC